MEENQQPISPSQPVQGETPVEQVSPEPEVQEEKSKFPKILIYVLSALFLLVLGASGFWFYQERVIQSTPSSSPTPSPSSDVTADWQTYINTEHGFSIKYPKNYTVQERKTSGSNPLQVQLKSSENEINIFWLKESPVYNMSLAEWYNNLLTVEIPYTSYGSQTSPEYTERKEIEIGGVKGIQLKQMGEYENVADILFPFSDAVVEISIEYESVEKLEIQKILSTFKFLDKEGNVIIPDLSENWETYRSSTYEIKYPSDFIFRLDEGSTAILQKWGPAQQEGTELYDGISISVQPREISTTLAGLTGSLERKAIEYQSEIISSPSPITLNGYQGMAFTEKGLGVWENIVLEKGSDSMFAHITVLVSDPGNLGFEQLKNQVLSTFKFID